MKNIRLLALASLFLVSTMQGFAQLTTIRERVFSPPTSTPILSGGDYYLPLLDTISNGIELFRTNGTAAGSSFYDVNKKGARNGFAYGPGVMFNNTYFFIGNDGKYGAELWKSTGTAAQTEMVADINPGSNSSYISKLYPFGSNLYFYADNGTANNAGQGIWRTAGTNATTEFVASLSGKTLTSDIVSMGGNLYFIAYSGPANTTSLYKSDGIPGGTTTAIASFYLALSPNLNVVNNKLVFLAEATSTSGEQLWASDGTAAGTTMIQDLNGTSTSGVSANYFTVIGFKLYFSARDAGANKTDLWVTDGIAANKVSFPSPGTYGSQPEYLTNYNGYLVMSSDDSRYGKEPFIYDGINAPTLIKDIITGTNSSYPNNFTVFTPAGGGGVYFAFDAANPSSTNYTTLWKSQGTLGSTTLISNTSEVRNCKNFFALSTGILFFEGSSFGSGPSKLYFTDGNSASLVKDINTSSNDQIEYMCNINGQMFFRVDDGEHGKELWRSYYSGGVPLFITEMITDINIQNDGSTPTDLWPLGASVLFSADDGEHGRELLGTTGNPNIFSVFDINPGLASSGAAKTKAVGGYFYFSADDGTNGRELWKTDLSYTSIVQNIAFGNFNSNPDYFTDVNGILFFKANGYIYKTDGTTTTQILAGGTTAYKDISRLTNVNGIVYFRSSNFGFSDGTLWKTDGTPAGTVEVKDGGNNIYGDNMGSITAANNFIFFTSYSSSFSYIPLMSVNSTTNVAKPLLSSVSGSLYKIDTLIAVNNKVFFTYNNGTNGRELWMSDGSVAGTYMVEDIYPGTNSSNPSNFMVIDGILYFSANDGVNGYELWRSDGTVAGTYLVIDIVSGSVSSNPIVYSYPGSVYSLIYANQTLYSIQNATLVTIGYGEPGVYTRGASSITTSDAVLSGEVTGINITNRGILVSTFPNANIGDNGVLNFSASSFSSGTFTITATGLTNGTKYYYRIYATNSNGTSLSSLDSFATFATPIVLPFIENFDGTTDNGWTSQITTGSSGTNNWQRGTPNKTLMNAAFSAPNAWVTKLNGNCDAYHNAYILSPILNFSNINTDPVLTFWHRFETESSSDDGGVVEISINGGAWRVLDKQLGTGPDYNTDTSKSWYNKSFLSSIYLFGGNRYSTNNHATKTNGWILSKTKLTGVASQSNVRIRFKFVTGNTTSYEGWAIDDINIIDGSVTTVNTGDATGIQATFATLNGYITYSNATLSATGIQVSNTLGGTTTNIDTNPLDSVSGFSVPFTNLTANTKYYYRVYATNTTGTTKYGAWDSFTTTPTLPYIENFDNNNYTGWTSGGANNDWHIAAPANSVNNAWVANVNNTFSYSNNQDSYLESPSFDFSTLTQDPVLQFYQAYWTDNFNDGLVVETSYNGGASWNRLDSNLASWTTGGIYRTNNSNSWYTNSNTIGSAGNLVQAPSFSNYALDGLVSSSRLTGAAGKNNVKIRFRFITDGAGNARSGWKIDSVQIYDIITPTLAASNVNLTNITSSSVTVNWTKGNGQRRLVVASPVGTTVVAPIDWKMYFADTYYATNSTSPGRTTGTNNYVVYSDTGSSVTVTGLTAGANYIFTVYEYNGKNMHVKFASGASVTLPVQLVSFTAEKLKNDVIAKWQTASEINNDHFDIERSVDGIFFTKVGEQKGAGNSSMIHDYFFIDENVNALFENVNVVYYRLKQVDANGEFAYSKIEAVVNNLTKSLDFISVKPNPFTTKFDISYASSITSDVTIEVTDLFGRTIYTSTLFATKGVNNFTMPDASEMSNGVYFVKLIQNGEVKVAKILKQD